MTLINAGIKWAILISDGLDMQKGIPLIIMLKNFNFIVAYITAITKRTYLQSSKKRNRIKNKKKNSLKYARSTYCFGIAGDYAVLQTDGTWKTCDLETGLRVKSGLAPCSTLRFIA